MRIWLKPDLLARLGLTVTDIQNAHPRAERREPRRADRRRARAARASSSRTRCARRVASSSPRTSRTSIVRENPDGSSVRIKDVARIELGSLNYQQDGTFNGKPARGHRRVPDAGLERARRGAQNISTDDGRAREAASRRASTTSSRSTRRAPVKAGIREIVETLLEAIGLVVLVVFVFLQSWRATLIPLLTVPVSLIGAFAVFPLLGFSVNTLSLFGLVLAIGLVVDDAIVVVEAVEHHIEEGMSPRDATFKAMSEVSGPGRRDRAHPGGGVHPGRLHGRHHRPALPAVRAHHRVLGPHLGVQRAHASPALSALLLRPRRTRTGSSVALGARLQSRLRSRHRRLRLGQPPPRAQARHPAGPARGRRRDRRCCSARKLPTGFVPDEDQGYAIIGVQLPDGASLQRTAPSTTRSTTSSRSSRASRRTTASPASASSRARPRATRARASSVSSRGTSARPPELTSTGIVKKPERAVLAASPRGGSSPSAPPAIPGISAAGGFSMMLQDRSGGDYEFLAQNVGKFIAEARKRPELEACARTSRPRCRSSSPTSTRTRPLKQGVPIERNLQRPADVPRRSYINDFSRFGRQWRVFVQAEPELPHDGRGHRAVLRAQRRGEMVPLSSFVHVRTRPRPRVHGALQPVPLGRDPSVARRRLQLGPGARRARGRRRQDVCRPRWASRGTRSRTRRRSPRAARRASSGSRSSSSSSSSRPCTRAGRCPSACF